MVLVAGLLLSTPIVRYLKNKFVANKYLIKGISENFGYALQLLLFIVSISFLIMNAHNPFIYFNF